MKLILCLLIFTLSCAVHKKDGPVFDKELTNFKYPFKVNTFEFNSQQQKMKMRYMDIGDKKASKVVVLLHGKNFSGFYWERIAKELRDRKYRVIIPDQIGFGKSTKPDFYQYSFANLSLNTKKLLDHLDITSFELVGHSMGGMLAVHMSTMYSRQVSKLVLVNPIGLEDYLKYVEFKDPSFFYKIEINKTINKFRDYQKKNYYDGKWSKNYEKLIVPFKGLINGSDYEVVAWNNALTYGPIFSEEIVTKLKEMKTPVHLIVGTRDRTGPGRNWKKKGISRKLGLYNKLGRDIKKLNSRIHLYELAGLGHMPQFEDYDAFSKAFYRIMK